MTAPLPARAWPRWPTLVALTLAVLGAHLVLLADGLPSGSAHPPAPSVPSLPTASAVLTRTISPDMAAPRPAAVLNSQVRWIAPPQDQPPALSQPAPSAAKAVVPQRKPRPAPPPSEPAPEAISVAAAPSPELSPAPPKSEPLPDTHTDPTATADETRDAAPEPANGALQTANNGIVLGERSAQPDPNVAPPDEKNALLGPAQPPASTQLNYDVEGKSKGLNYNATGSLDWRNEGSAYTARMEIRVFLLGSRLQTSQGQLAPTGLQPERFADKSRSERAAHFDRPQNRIRFSNNAPDAELLPGAQDRLSVFLQLASLLNARPQAYPAGHSIDIPVAGAGGSEIWRFRVQGLTSLDLPAGTLIAQQLVREAREPRDTQVDIWLAPSLGHLPVRIRLTQDNGDVVDQRLKRLP